MQEENIQGGPKNDTSRTYITLYERYHVFGPPGRSDKLLIYVFTAIVKRRQFRKRVESNQKPQDLFQPILCNCCSSVPITYQCLTTL